MQGSPNPRPWTSTGHHTGQHTSPQPPGLTSRLRTELHIRRWASEWSFICVYSHSPLLTLLHYHSVIIIEIKGTINAMHLNHPKAIPLCLFPQSVEKFSSMKLVPGAKKVGDHCSTSSVKWILHRPLPHKDVMKVTSENIEINRTW